MNQIIVHTKRLVLRTVTYDDIDLVIKNMNLYGEPISAQEAKKEIGWMFENHESNKPENLIHLCFAVFYKENSNFIGWCGLDNTKKEYVNPVLFYRLKKEYWNRGILTELGKELLKIGFIDYKLQRIDGACENNNAASKRVLEKIGMEYLGLSRDGSHSFSICKDNFLKRNIRL
jgi:[ribosomal protein S5]-alanine N-acetyltransferase